MSGHNKWAKIKHKKAGTDAQRGKLFSRLIKEITIAARNGGGDPNGNPRLRLAIQTAKGANMPADNIKRAVQRGTGELPGAVYEELTYEGYGPAGVALMVELVTDNKNRTVAEIRHILDRNNGKLAEAGSVAWMFQKKGSIEVPKSGIGEDDLLAIILEAGADDMRAEDDYYDITTSADAFEAVKKAIEDKGVTISNASLQLLPQNTVRVEGKEAEQVLKLMEALEEHDDVQNVFANFDIDDSVLAQLNQ
ncbi:MAG: YebC/PmpR family DNA-binding transcriptional regulator [Bacteroidetes bacterium]|nr:YebC/PmpR family DNA-binding transcriptional regulator [Bacteroidota bacterium]MCL5033783.1 YebC/PmpR family DNA-binding transcriptional regulator [Bacteroidota bacterium]